MYNELKQANEDNRQISKMSQSKKRVKLPYNYRRNLKLKRRSNIMLISLYYFNYEATIRLRSKTKKITKY